MRRQPGYLDTRSEAISSGAHRLSEIASGMGKPITHLNRPIQRLIDLGYIKREIPYGIPHRNAKKTQYKIADPFINFYFSYVVPEKTSLEMGLADRIYKEVVEPGFPAYCSGYWEELCRASIPMVFRDKLFKPGSRWWGTTIGKDQVEIDVVASSQDGTEVIVGEAKWTTSVNIHSLCNDLNQPKLSFTIVKNIKFDLRSTINSLVLSYNPGHGTILYFDLRFFRSLNV